MKKVVVTGATGQDGSLMIDFLLANTDYQIYGVVRPLSVNNHDNIKHLKNEPRFKLIEGDITDPHNVSGLMANLKPEYFINFAANSFVGNSWKHPAQVMQTNTISVLHQLEAIRKESPNTRYYQAGSSEEFGDVVYSPQDEQHPLRPRSPYGASKASARHLVKVYRESYGLYAVAGVLFNHESFRRGKQFVTRKITNGVAQIYHALKNDLPFKPIELGNLDAQRDWSNAEDFIEGIWRMLNQELYTNTPWDIHMDEREYTKYLSTKIKNYVLSSGTPRSIRDFIGAAFAAANIDIIDSNPDRISPCKDNNTFQVNYSLKSSGEPLIVINPEFYRPNELEFLCGNSQAIQHDLGWQPKTNFSQLVAKMIETDIKLLTVS